MTAPVYTKRKYNGTQHIININYYLTKSTKCTRKHNAEHLKRPRDRDDNEMLIPRISKPARCSRRSVQKPKSCPEAESGTIVSSRFHLRQSCKRVRSERFTSVRRVRLSFRKKISVPSYLGGGRVLKTFYFINTVAIKFRIKRVCVYRRRRML